ncbi:hypothetical protein VPH35_133622 [Triticum aestivum]
MEHTAVVVDGDAPASSTDCDWTDLPSDLLVRIFGTLQIPDLFSSGGVCCSRRRIHLEACRFRLCSPHQAPCLVYSAADRDDSTATLHHLTTDKICHVTIPGPAFRSRYVITADDRSHLILVNPITGAQVAMPPPESMHNVKLRYDEEDRKLDGSPPLLDGYDLIYVDTEQGRFCFYIIVAMSCDPSSKDCVVVRVHKPQNLLSYARVGDTKWTCVDTHEECKCYVDVCYNNGDGLFYALRGCGDVHTIDLCGQSPLVNIVYKHKADYDTDSKYIVQASWGDLFQIWRWDRYLEDDEEVVEDNDDNDVDEGVEELVEREEDEDQEEEVAQNADVLVEVDNADVLVEERTMENDDEKERVTAHFVVYKIDFVKQNLKDHTLFTGFNTSFSVPAKDFPTLIPNSIYHTDDLNHNTFSKRFSDRRALIDKGLRQVFIFNMEDCSFTNILAPHSSRLNWPPPVWILP